MLMIRVTSFEANFGYNGSERFAKKERFLVSFLQWDLVGLFLVKRSGMMILKKTINKLKLKVTHGLSGNDAIGRPEDRFSIFRK